MREHSRDGIPKHTQLLVNSRPAILVEYSPPRAGTESRGEVKDTSTYILDEDSERYGHPSVLHAAPIHTRWLFREKLLELLKLYLEQNSQARVQCMRCLKIYDRLAGMDVRVPLFISSTWTLILNAIKACKSCGSTYIVHYEEEKIPKTSVSPSPPSTAMSKNESAVVENNRYRLHWINLV